MFFLNSHSSHIALYRWWCLFFMFFPQVPSILYGRWQGGLWQLQGAFDSKQHFPPLLTFPDPVRAEGGGHIQFDNSPQLILKLQFLSSSNHSFTTLVQSHLCLEASLSIVVHIQFSFYEHQVTMVTTFICSTDHICWLFKLFLKRALFRLQRVI